MLNEDEGLSLGSDVIPILVTAQCNFEFANFRKSCHYVETNL